MYLEPIQRARHRRAYDSGYRVPYSSHKLESLEAWSARSACTHLDNLPFALGISHRRGQYAASVQGRGGSYT